MADQEIDYEKLFKGHREAHEKQLKQVDSPGDAGAQRPGDAGAPDIGAGAAGAEHGANQFFFGMLPKFMEAAGKYGVEDMGLGKLPETNAAETQARLDTSEAQHPIAAAVGKGTAELAHQAALAPIMPFARGGTALKAIANTAASGAAEGGLQGAGHAVGQDKPLDMDTLLDIGKQAALGGVFGAAGGGIGHGIARAAQPGLARVGTLGQGIADDMRAAFGAGAPVLEQAGAKALPAEAAQVGGLIANNPAQQAAGKRLATEVGTLARRGDQLPELAAEKGAQQAAIKRAADEAQLATAGGRAKPSATASKVADIVNQPIAGATGAPAKKLSELTVPDVLKILGPTALLGAAGGQHSLGSALVGGVAPTAAKVISEVSKTLGAKGAVQLYIKDPAAFMAQYGNATAINRPLGLLAQEGLSKTNDALR